MFKINFYLIILLLILNFTIHAFVPNYGNLDESISLEKKDYQLGAFLTIASNPLLVISYLNNLDNSTTISSYNYFYQRIPIFYLGFMGRFGIGKNMELGINSLISSPPFLSLGSIYYVVELYNDFSFKKTFFNKNDFFIAYKFNIGTGYLFITKGANIILKNSIIIGKKFNDKVELNIIPSMQNSIFTGLFEIFGNFIYGSIIPEIDLNLHFFINNTILILDFFIYDEVIFTRSAVENVGNYQTIMLNTLAFGISFGINFRKNK